MKPAPPVRVRNCARHALLAAGGLAVIAALLWWLPSLALMAARLVLDRLRFRLALGLGCALVAADLPAAAARVFAAEAERAGRRVRALRGRSR